MNQRFHRVVLAAGLAVVLGLGGCWGDDDEEVTADPPVTPTPVTAVPASAGVSVAAFISYLLSLGSSDETSEPLTIGDSFAVPADESSEPTPL
jgi:hypothetical protein